MVRDDLQGHGIGTELMQALIEIAHDQGLACLEGLVLATNHKSKRPTLPQTRTWPVAIDTSAPTKEIANAHSTPIQKPAI